MNEDRAGHICQQLAEIRQRGIEFPSWAKPPSWLQSYNLDASQFRLKPPIDLHVLNAFEGRHQIQLPAEYREFLLYVGDGGAGPYAGLLTLEQAEEKSGRNLKAPNPFISEDDAPPGWFERFENDEHYDTIDDGALLIVDDKYHELNVLLIVSGPYRGRIVYRIGEFDYPPIFILFPNFLLWYETWVRETLAGYEMGGFGHGLPLDQSQSLAVAIDIKESSVRRKAAIDNLRRAPRLQSGQLVVLQRAFLKEDNADLASSMFVHLLKDGIVGLEEMSWQLLERTQSIYYQRIIRAMRKAGMVEWVSAAEWAISQDADDDSVSYLLCDLKDANELTDRFMRKVLSSQRHTSMALYLKNKRS